MASTNGVAFTPDMHLANLPDGFYDHVAREIAPEKQKLDVVLRQNALDEVAYKFGDEMLTLRLAQGQSYLRGAAAHKKGSPK